MKILDFPPCLTPDLLSRAHVHKVKCFVVELRKHVLNGYKNILHEPADELVVTVFSPPYGAVKKIGYGINISRKLSANIAIPEEDTLKRNLTTAAYGDIPP